MDDGKCSPHFPCFAFLQALSLRRDDSCSHHVVKFDSEPTMSYLSDWQAMTVA